MKRLLKALGIGLALLLPAAFFTLRILSGNSVECEVCMEYNGRTDCRKALGPDQEHCQRTATDNACGLLASGMTESIACTGRAPAKVTFSN